MGFQLRKTIKKGPLNINISKSGIGVSLGCKGLRSGVSGNGIQRSTLSIPGTGIRYVKSKSVNSKK